MLAAGQGARMRPLTDKQPKCLIQVGGKALLDRQISVSRSVGIRDIAVVRGYLKDSINFPDITYFENQAYATTNMVATLWCAESIFDNGFIASYGDIIYEPFVLERLLASDHAVSVVIDQKWKMYWERRFKNVLDDAETLQVDRAGRITSIGQKPDSIDQIDGQYIGLTMFKGEGVDILRTVYVDAQQEADQGLNPLRGQRSPGMLYMTDILQGIIDTGFPIHQVVVDRGWLEIDSLKDLEVANRSIEVDGDKFTIAI